MTASSGSGIKRDGRRQIGELVVIKRGGCRQWRWNRHRSRCRGGRRIDRLGHRRLRQLCRGGIGLRSLVSNGSGLRRARGHRLRIPLATTDQWKGGNRGRGNQCPAPHLHLRVTIHKISDSWNGSKERLHTAVWRTYPLVLSGRQGSKTVSIRQKSSPTTPNFAVVYVV